MYWVEVTVKPGMMERLLFILLLTGQAAGLAVPRRAGVVRGAGAGAPRPKVLMVHGYVQNGTVFEGRMKSAVRKMLKLPGGADFLYVDAPHAVAADRAAADRPLEAQRAWFNPGEADASVRPVDSFRYVGWEASIAFLEAVADAEGPFHAVVSFSQGAPLAALLVARRPAACARAVFVAGFAPRDPAAAAAFDDARGGAPLLTPSLHIVGETDPFARTRRLAPRGRRAGRSRAQVSVERAAALAACFDGAEVATHGGGHVVPPPALKDVVRAFFRRGLHVR